MNILRDGTVIHTVETDENTILTTQLMADDRVDATWKSAQPLDITLGDYIEVGAEKYYLNRKPDVEKRNNFTYVYTAVFESEVYRLFNKIYMDEGAAEFTYFGDPEDHLLLLIENINSIDSGWTLDYQFPGNVVPRFISYNGDSCRSALTKIVEEFELEFRLVQRTIIVRQDVGFPSTYVFEYGRQKGLYSLFRSSDPDQNGVITRLYAFGGNRNLAFDYRQGSRRLVFEQEGKRYLEANTELFGIREGTVTFDDIFPSRTGSVVSSSAPNRFIDTAIDFDLNDFLLEGTVAKVVFKSGALSGYEFEIRTFNNTTKEVIFNDFLEANDLVLPNELNKPEEGDTYTIVDIRMPETYIEEAEAKLLQAAEDYLEKKKSPTATYTLQVDEKFVRTNGIELSAGKRVRVVDSALGLDEQIRIFAISYPLVNPSKITAEIADRIPYTKAERLIKDNSTVKGEVVDIDRTRAENYRDAIRRVRQLQGRVFDPDGFFDMTNIRPGSIETLQLAVGANSQNFGLNGVEIEPNFEGDANRIRLSGGSLIHFEIEIEELGFIWQLDPLITNTLDPNEFYYVYCRCNKSALQGTWVVSTQQIRTEDEPGFYHFWVGILYEVQNDRRYFMFTKGMTFIVGDTITTGRIKSLDGLNFFDLSQGTFKIGDDNSSIDWGVTGAGQLTLNGVIVSKMIFTEDAEIVNLLVSSLRTRLTGKRIEIKESSNNIEFYDESNNLVLVIDDEIDQSDSASPLAGLRITNPENNDAVYMSGNGHFANGSGVPFLAPSTGFLTNASMVGLLRRRNISVQGISAAVAGIDQTTEGNSISYGGFFDSLMAQSLSIGVVQITGNYTIPNRVTYVSCYNSSSITVTLPANPRRNQVLFIKRVNSSTVNVNANGRQIIANGGPQNTREINPRGLTLMLVWDGSFWQSNGL